jgi:Flp pilus assembly protein TadD
MGCLRMEKKRLQQIVGIGLLLAAITLILYWPVQHFGFVEFDDDIYVAHNPKVATGLSRESLIWAFRNFDAGMWHPLTWLSHLLDVEIYQFNAGGHHWTSVQIHLASAVLLLIVLSAMTGTFWASALAAALFAIHPLHVESVAWVAERKDVLCGFFWILVVGLYAFYVKKPSLKRYLLILAAFMLGLFSKPMIVTLPVVLLLLDYWPLKRFQGTTTFFDSALSLRFMNGSHVALRLVAEKTPLLLLSVASAGLAIIAQQNIGALSSFESYPLESRLANAPVACVTYLGKMFWPVDLSVFYPHPGLQPLWKVAGSILALGGVTAFAFRMARRYPYLVVGWLWYLISLLPVLGIVQVGSHAMADRYTYIPLIGVFIMIAWSLGFAAQRWHRAKKGIVVLGCGMILGSFILSSTQLEYWRDYRTLFEHANRVTERNHIACNNLGVVSFREGEVNEAIRYLTKAVEIKNDYRDAWLNLGIAHLSRQSYEEAAICFRNAVWIDPVTLKNRIVLAVTLKYAGQAEASVDEFLKVVERDPGNAEAHSYLGIIRLEQGRLEDAEAHFSAVIRLHPGNADAHNNLGLVLDERGRTDDAVAHFRQASALSPGNPGIEGNLKRVLARTAR